MPNPSVTYTFTNGTTASGPEVTTNFNDLISSLIDGTKSIYVAGVRISGLTASRAIVTDGSSNLSAATTTATEIGYLNGVTSAVQTQINNLGKTVTTITNNDATVTDADGFGTFLFSTGNTGRTLTLPTAADNTNRIIHVKKTDSGTGSVTVDGEGAETVDGVANFLLVDQDDFVEVQCTGTAWVVKAKGIGSRVISRVKDEVGAGMGSTNTMIRRIETNVVTTGNAITRAVSASNGNSYTVNANGIYSIQYADAKSAGGGRMGISKSSAELTTSIFTIVNTTRLGMIFADASNEKAISWIGRLAAGDVIRPHTSGAFDLTDLRVAFDIERIGV